MRMVSKLSFAAALGVIASVSACSDPVPPAPQAIASVALTSPVDASEGNCTAQHTVSIPVVPSYSGLIVTQSSWRGNMMENDKGGTVSCSVKPSGSGFTVSGTVDLSADTSKDKWGTISVSIPEISDQESGVTGTLTVGDASTAGEGYTGSCKFSVSGDRLQVAKGRIWGSVQCDQVRIPTYPGAVCGVGLSYFIFQNCSQ